MNSVYHESNWQPHAEGPLQYLVRPRRAFLDGDRAAEPARRVRLKLCRNPEAFISFMVPNEYVVFRLARRQDGKEELVAVPSITEEKSGLKGHVEISEVRVVPERYVLFYDPFETPYHAKVELAAKPVACFKNFLQRPGELDIQFFLGRRNPSRFDPRPSHFRIGNSSREPEPVSHIDCAA